MSALRVIKRQQKGEKAFDMSLQQKDIDRLLLTQPLKRFREEGRETNLDLRALLRTESRIVRLKDREVLYSEEAYGDSCFILLSGQVDSYLPKNSESNSNLLDRSHAKRSLWSAFCQLFDSHNLKERRDLSLYMSTKDRGLASGPSSRQVLDEKIILDHDFVLSRMYQPSDLLGHISAVARTPRYELVVSKGNSELLELKWQVLRELHRNAPGLRELIELDYKQYGLKSFLRTIPELSQCASRELDELIAQASFETYGRPDWNLSFKKQFNGASDTLLANKIEIALKGDCSEQVFLVRSGFVSIDDGQSASYKTRGAVIGLNEESWQSDILDVDVHALTFAELVKVPKALLKKYVLADDKKNHSKNKIAVTQLYGENLLVNGRKSMLINLDKCTECDDCVTACANAHGGNPRFVRQGPSVAQFMTANACMHCKDPVCTIGCPTGAIRRSSAEGTVLISDQLCIGCSSCANSCPYGNIQMTNIVDEQGRLVVDEQHKPIVKATKCDLCVDQKTGPACERACPNGALKRVDIEDIDQQASSWVKA